MSWVAPNVFARAIVVSDSGLENAQVRLESHPQDRVGVIQISALEPERCLGYNEGCLTIVKVPRLQALL